MLSFGLSHAVPSIGDKHHGDLIFPVTVHQVSKTLLGCRDGRAAPNQHPIDVEEEAKGVGALTREKGGTGSMKPRGYLLTCPETTS